MLRGLVEENGYACIRLVLLIGEKEALQCLGKWGWSQILKPEGQLCLSHLPCCLMQSRGCLWINVGLDWRISLGKIPSLELEISSSGDSTAALGHLLWPLNFLLSSVGHSLP